MNDPTPISSFPQYAPPANPKGIPVATREQSSQMWKGMKAMGRMMHLIRSRKDLTSRDRIRIKHRKKPRFY